MASICSPLSVQWSHDLHQAAFNGDASTLQQILEQGHPPDIVGGVVCWLRGAYEVPNRTPLHYSAKRGHLRCIRLLLRHGANPNARDYDGYTPVHYVCQIHNPDDNIHDVIQQCLWSLIEFGADTKLRTKSGHTPLDIAKQQKNAVCINEVLKKDLQVQSLLILSRNAVSMLIHNQLLEPTQNLWIPESLKRYLLFEDVVTKWNK